MMIVIITFLSCFHYYFYNYYDDNKYCSRCNACYCFILSYLLLTTNVVDGWIINPKAAIRTATIRHRNQHYDPRRQTITARSRSFFVWSSSSSSSATTLTSTTSSSATDVATSTTTTTTTTATIKPSALFFKKWNERNHNNDDKKTNNNHKINVCDMIVEECIGSGSYGTVHPIRLSLTSSIHNDNIDMTVIGKRSWTKEEMVTLQKKQKEQQQHQSSKRKEHLNVPDVKAHDNKNDNKSNNDENNNTIEMKAKRCNEYWDVENYCFQKLSSKNHHDHLPNYLGTIRQQIQNKNVVTNYDWMIFEPIHYHDNEKVLSLEDILEKDRIEHHTFHHHHHHHLYYTSQYLFPQHTNTNTSLGNVLDKILLQLLNVTSFLHEEHSIIHRDIKPSNLLVDDRGNIILIDFGSAADISTIGLLQSNIGCQQMDIVTVSPLYSAPELYIDRYDIKSSYQFDVYSIGILYFQLLFQYYNDERMVATLRSQLHNYQYNLDLLLQSLLQSKIRPKYIEDALDVLEERSGLWYLLQQMLQPNPKLRIDSRKALRTFQNILHQQRRATNTKNDHDELHDDGPYLREVLLARQQGCLLLDDDDDLNNNSNDIIVSTKETLSLSTSFKPSDETLNTTPLSTSGDDYIMEATIPATTFLHPRRRSLHYVATFDRSEPIGLILSELDSNDDDDNSDTNDMDPQLQQQSLEWKEFCQKQQKSSGGEVYIKGIIPNGQADLLRILQIGDRLHGIGELSFYHNGFERAIEMIQDQPRGSKSITLHFDRKPYTTNNMKQDSNISTLLNISKTTYHNRIYVTDQGAWKSKGKRAIQEDTYVLYEIHDTSGQSYVIAGIFDGHLGPAASLFVQERLPSIFHDEIIEHQLQNHKNDGTPVESLQQIIEKCWEKLCASYRETCSIDECVAEYDAVEGILMANTGSKDTVAGTTATIYVMNQENGQLVSLNCGDSRGIVVSKDGTVHYKTIDHTPQYDYERFVQGKKIGYDYAIPKCMFGTWRVAVGDYDYAVSRSLEGPYATSKGIISTPDIYSIPMIESGMNILIASDGFWEVIDSEEAAKLVYQYKTKRNMNANDIAKQLCALAIQKGSSDNVSVVVLFLE